MFLAVYNAANSSETGKPLVRVTARVMRDGQPVTRPFDFVLTDVQNHPMPHLKFAEFIGLANLSPGRYLVAIETKDMVTRKFTRQEAAFEILP